MGFSVLCRTKGKGYTVPEIKTNQDVICRNVLRQTASNDVMAERRKKTEHGNLFKQNFTVMTIFLSYIELLATKIFGKRNKKKNHDNVLHALLSTGADITPEPRQQLLLAC